MSSFPKFKNGDKIQTTFGGRGIILSCKKEEGIFRYRVRLENKATISYDENDLKFSHDDLQDKVTTVITDRCPKCSAEWSISRFGTKTWHDCPSCKRTAEDLCRTGGAYVSKQDDDEDDFGYYGLMKYLIDP